MNFFQGSSNFSIEGGNFSNVAGSQNNYHVAGKLQLSDPTKETRQVTAWDQYQELKTGDIRLKKKVAETTVKRRDAEGWSSWRNLDARRIIYTASVHGEDRREREFLYVKYDGPDAVQAHHQDFEHFSAVKDIDYIQLFGYSTWNVLPSLVFYDALVPVAHVFERNGFPSLLHTYFDYASLTQGIEAKTLLRELWIKPGTGILCKGPYVEDSSSTLYQVWPGTTPALPSSSHPFLDLQTYNNTGLLFRYLIGILPIQDIIQGIRRSFRATPEHPNNRDAKFILSFLPGTIYHRTSLEIIARYSGDRERWYYDPWEKQFRIPDAMRENILVIDDRSVRFMLKPADIASLESFELYYLLRPRGIWVSFMDSWVSQAHGIFIQLGIEESEWEEYAILGHFWLKLERDEESHTPADIPNSTPIYLFIRPVPRPSDNDNGWDDWLAGTMYYWSFDSVGKEEMSQGEQQRLGLPSFRTTVVVGHSWWNHDAYDAIGMVNRHQGFDPASLGLARSLGQTILEVAGRNTRFEEVNDEDDKASVIDISAELAHPSALPSEFEERIRWIPRAQMDQILQMLIEVVHRDAREFQ